MKYIAGNGPMLEGIPRLLNVVKQLPAYQQMIIFE